MLVVVGCGQVRFGEFAAWSGNLLKNSSNTAAEAFLAASNHASNHEIRGDAEQCVHEKSHAQGTKVLPVRGDAERCVGV